MNEINKETNPTNFQEEKILDNNSSPFANFSLTCPHCQKTLTSQDFDQNHFTIAHLQSLSLRLSY